MPLNYRPIIVNNTRKEMDYPAKENKAKKKGGDREEEIKDSHSIDSEHRFLFHFQSGRRAAGGAVPILPLLPLYNRNKEP